MTKYRFYIQENRSDMQYECVAEADTAPDSDIEEALMEKFIAYDDGDEDACISVKQVRGYYKDSGYDDVFFFDRYKLIK